ncbi:type II secretion system protein J [Flavobacterium sp. RHBU_24]|uniref:PulJ/GspJ family protein n=1 Tax=Flavobacterium sp. RHBU_24 TaxID=3391185 RepID=UPI003984DCD7
MNKKGGHIRAFTIIEAVIGMVITAIIMSIIFVVFTITSERLLDFKQANIEIVDLNRVNYALNKDMFESKYIEYNDGVLKFLMHDDASATYAIDRDILTRYSDEFIDTFHIHVANMYFDTISSLNKRQSYKRINLKLIDGKKSFNTYFYKKIYPAELINSHHNEY